MQGQLGEDVVANVLQYLSLKQATGCLQLSHGSYQGQVYLESGRVVHVVGGNLSGVEALAWQLTWTEGDFIFQPNVPAPAHTIKLSVDQVLLQAVYQVDVSRMNKTPVLTDKTILAPKAASDGQNTINMTLRALQLLRFLDGKQHLSEVARRLNWSLDDALATAEELCEQSLVEISDGLALEEILSLWSRVIARLEAYCDRASTGSFRQAWSKVGNALADDYPCLDPFAPELKYQDETLSLTVDDPDPDFTEALGEAVLKLAAYYRLEPDRLKTIIQREPNEFTRTQLEQSGLSRLLRA